MNYMLRPTNGIAIDLFPHPELESEEDLRISPGAYSSPVRHAHALYCSYSLLVPSLTAQLGLHLPSHTPCRSCLRCVGLPMTVQAYKPTETPPRPASHHATNTVSLTICRGAVDRVPLTPGPRRSPASVHMDFHFAPRYACFLGLVMWPSLSLSPKPPCALLTLTCAH